MSDVNVDKWKQKGDLYLWRYLENSRNFPGWHLTANDICCFALNELFETMLAAHWSSEKTLTLSEPTKEVLSVPNNRGGAARFKYANLLIIKHLKEEVANNYFALEAENKQVRFSVGSDKLKLLKNCIYRITKREGDYAINVNETRLWFWWLLKNCNKD